MQLKSPLLVRFTTLSVVTCLIADPITLHAIGSAEIIKPRALSFARIDEQAVPAPPATAFRTWDRRHLAALLCSMTAMQWGTDASKQFDQSAMPEKKALRYVMGLVETGALTHVYVDYRPPVRSYGKAIQIDVHEKNSREVKTEILEAMHALSGRRRYTVIVREECSEMDLGPHLRRVVWLLPEPHGGEFEENVSLTTRIRAVDAIKSLPVIVSRERLTQVQSDLMDLYTLLPASLQQTSQAAYVTVSNLAKTMEAHLTTQPVNRQAVLSLRIALRHYLEEVAKINLRAAPNTGIASLHARLKATIDEGWQDFTNYLPDTQKTTRQEMIIGIVDASGLLFEPTVREGIYVEPRSAAWIDTRDPASLKDKRFLAMSFVFPFHPNKVRILPPEPYRTPDISNGFVVRSELTQMHRTFPDADLESIRLTLDQIGVQRSQTVLTSSPEWAVLLLYQGAHVIFLSKDADRLRRLRDGYTSVVGIARKQGGLLQIVEGDITDPAVLVYLGDWHGFDHIALLSGASAEVLARLKKPGQGTFYQGPFLNEREASLFSESLRRSGVVLGENRPVLMPGSGNNYYGRVYPLGLARGKTPPSSLSESKISSADQTPRSRWDRWTGGYINRISLWAARWVTCDPYRAWGLSLLIFMTRNAARAEGMQGVAPPSKFSFFLVAALFAMMLTGAIRWFLANPPFEHPPVRITWADYRTEKKRSVNDFALTKEPVDDWEYRSTHYRWSLYEAPWRHVFAISAGLTGAAILSLTFVLGFPDRASPEEFVLLFTLGVASLCSWAAVRLSLDANGWQTAGKSAIRNYSGALSRLETLLVRKQRQVIRLFLAGVAASTALLIYDIYLIARRPPSVFDHLSRADSAAYRVWSTAA